MINFHYLMLVSGEAAGYDGPVGGQQRQHPIQGILEES